MPKKEFVFLTIFPKQIENYFDYSIPKKSKEDGHIGVEIINTRKESFEQIDDYAFGGGGMVLMFPPILKRLREHGLLDEHIILMNPRGARFNQQKAIDISEITKKIVFICGHYEGVDERISDFVTEEISIGDYVLTSGELSSLIVADSVIRLLPNVINPESLCTESFADGLLDYPCYTRPKEFENKSVPDILLSGNHKKIEEYRHLERLRITKIYRPDLYKKFISKKK